MEIVLTYILQVRNINAPTCFACVLSIFGWKKDIVNTLFVWTVLSCNAEVYHNLHLQFAMWHMRAAERSKI